MISEFKANCVAMLERVFCKVHHRASRKPEPDRTWLGAMRDSGEIVGDVVAPPDVQWDALNGKC
jgi:hypothetical protein